MPKKAIELSAIAVRKITKPGFHAVGGVAGLLLRVSKTGARAWILRVTIGVKRRDIGLGGFPDVGLLQARDKARFCREKIEQGIDPIEERRQVKERLKLAQINLITFDQAAKKVAAIKKQEFKSDKHAAIWIKSLETYASPVIGKIPVSEIQKAHVLKVLEPIWQTKTETASRVRGRIEKVLAWAIASDYSTGENPASWKGNLDQLLSKPNKTKAVKHFKAVPWQEISAFIKSLQAREGTAAKALEFLILTAARSGEIRGATWQEIDIKNRLWSIPAARMKMGKTHNIPLSDQAIALLESLPKGKTKKPVFIAPRGGVLSDMSILAVVKRMKVDAVPHGFRSSFRDWIAENTNFPHHVAEMALAHAIGNKVEAAYRRGDLIEKRIRLMQAWADYCYTEQKKGDVIRLNKKAVQS